MVGGISFFLVGATLAVAQNLPTIEYFRCGTAHPCCHSERNEMKSRNLRTDLNNYVSLMRRSLDSLCSLGMTYFGISSLTKILRYRYLLGGVMTPPYMENHRIKNPRGRVATGTGIM